jgi:transcriptional regulator with XRE-family HTH domain
MFDVGQFLDRAKAGAGIQSDYALAKRLGVLPSRISNWRRGENAPDGRAIMGLCGLSGDDPEHVAACIQSMRAANDDEAFLWRRVAERLARGGAHVIAAVGVTTLFVASVAHHPEATAALPSNFDDGSLYIMLT